MATNLLRSKLRAGAALLLALGTTHALAASPQGAIERFLRQQADGLPGRVQIKLAARATADWPACDDPQPFMPAGVRAWGRVSVGVRCAAPAPWTRYASATVAVIAPYQVATRSIAAGEALDEAAWQTREGDLAALPAGVVTDPAELAGKVAANRIAAGAPLRRELLRGALVIRQGQEVRVVVHGPGFAAGIEGKALSDAAVGATVQVRARNGKVLSGVAREDGAVERAH